MKTTLRSIQRRNGFVVEIVVGVGLFVLIGGLTLGTALMSGEPGCQGTLGKDPFSDFSLAEHETLQNCRSGQARQAEILGAGGSLAASSSPGTSAKDAIAAWGPGLSEKLATQLEKPAPKENAPLPGDPIGDDDDDDDIVDDDDDDDTTGDTLCERLVANLDRCDLLSDQGALGPNPDDAILACNYIITDHPLAVEMRCNFECMLGFPDCADQVDPAIIDLCDEDCSP